MTTTSNQPTSQEAPEPAPPASVSIFDDPTVARTMVEDPVFRFLKKQWSNVLFGILLVGLVIYGYGKLKQNTRLRNSEAADRLHRVTALFNKLSETRAELKTIQTETIPAGANPEEVQKNQKAHQEKLDAKQKVLDENRTKLSEVLRAMGDDRQPYLALAGLYQGLLARDDGNLDLMRSKLKVDWKQTGTEDSTKMVSEISNLALARALVANKDKAEEGRALLIDLAESAKFVSLPAALSLARIAETKEQAQKAQALIDAAKARAAKHKELIDPELKQLQALLK